ncbi:hypothetical protein GUITHDRAFT_120191 [Guillardia theta CCMP2712]|uniref:Uncharacterized protein n=1 Tax=Guillardia theta (strain CCMP2712) TaxID=905079 RepID=L1IBX8_GUITC|nr:hypothetical protein GUITHDRAFT_120191 [Guillardia theta CCMP2712]EKX33602.1 hypothetical protein GUITHDRAFT_120191 [Guillardia theta CCMP2712]|eukprot:XP_005820582.1 hypothetical protein GUITHDRAFT_120191 [Guillardia theta CCMP2712]
MHASLLLALLWMMLCCRAQTGEELECASLKDCLNLASVYSSSALQHERMKAHALYERACRYGEDSKDAWLGKGALEQDAGRLEEAWRSLCVAFLLDPSCWRVGINMGNLAARRQQFGLAHRLFKHLTRVNPFLPQAHYSLGFLNLLYARYPSHGMVD